MADAPADPNKRIIAKPGKTGKPPRRRRRGGITFLLFIGVIVAVALFLWAENQRRTVEKRLAETESRLEEVQNSTERSGQQVAEEVLNKVRNHLDIPTDPAPTVATIVDVDRLRETSEFYNKAENGDHLIITENRAILYDAERDIILDVVPVRLNSTQDQQAGEGGQDPNATPDPNASPTPEVSPTTAPPARQSPTATPTPTS